MLVLALCLVLIYIAENLYDLNDRLQRQVSLPGMQE